MTGMYRGQSQDNYSTVEATRRLQLPPIKVLGEMPKTNPAGMTEVFAYQRPNAFKVSKLPGVRTRTGPTHLPEKKRDDQPILGTVEPGHIYSKTHAQERLELPLVDGKHINPLSNSKKNLTRIGLSCPVCHGSGKLYAVPTRTSVPNTTSTPNKGNKYSPRVLGRTGHKLSTVNAIGRGGTTLKYFAD